MNAASPTYLRRREELEDYFDRTAVEAWKRLTSDAPVSGIRATVRAGRDRMRTTLLDWLPDDLSGRFVLDAGCGTGAFAVEAARRGAAVTAIDLSPSLVEMARQRCPTDLGGGSVAFRTGDMTDATLGRFDHVVAMDSLIHYPEGELVRLVTTLAERATTSLVFTFAPRTAMLSLMHAVGRTFPRSDRAPAIEPIKPDRLRRLLAEATGLRGYALARQQRVVSGFYTSEALEVRRP